MDSSRIRTGTTSAAREEAGQPHLRLGRGANAAMVRAMKFAVASFFTLALASTVACGGSSTPATAPSQTTYSDSKTAEHKEGGPGEHGEHKEGHGDHHAGISPALKDFHGVLSPVWHSDAGKVRVEKACSSTASMADKAKATGDADLVAAVAALEPACAAPNRPEVEAKLGTVHDRFHALAEPKKH